MLQAELGLLSDLVEAGPALDRLEEEPQPGASAEAIVGPPDAALQTLQGEHVATLCFFKAPSAQSHFPLFTLPCAIDTYCNWGRWVRALSSLCLQLASGLDFALAKEAAGSETVIRTDSLRGRARSWMYHATSELVRAGFHEPARLSVLAFAVQVLLRLPEE